MNCWTEDRAAAAKWATQHWHGTAPPDWLRCDYFYDGQRCIGGSGHSGDHKPPKASK